MKGERTVDDKPSYKDKNEFSENKFKEALERGFCWSCKHLRKFNGDLDVWVCVKKGSVVLDTRRRECDDMWEERA